MPKPIVQGTVFFGGPTLRDPVIAEAVLPRNIEAELIARTMQMRIERIGFRVKEMQMADKMPNTTGLASAIDKLTFAIEADAKQRLERVQAIHEKRQRVFGKADAKLNARDASLDAADAALDKLDEALGDNGGPTLGDSSQSPEHGADGQS